MGFKIEFKKPKKLGKFDPNDSTVSEAISSIYLEYCNNIFITWNECKLYLDVKGDLSDIYNDIVRLIIFLKSDKDEYFVNFLSSSFTAEWVLKKENQSVKIIPKWFDVTIEYNGKITGMEHLNSLDNSIIVDINYFIYEWNKLLLSVKNDLLKVGYSNALQDFEYLDKLDSKLKDN